MTAELTVREMTAADAPYVVELCAGPHVRAHVHAPTLEQVVAGLGEPETGSFVAEAEGRRVGFMRVGRLGDPVWFAELRIIVIGEPGKGFGALAVRWAQHHAFVERGAHRMYLEVRAHNDRARRLYEWCGFIEEGRFRDGFRADDGTYGDLIPYGMLRKEYEARRATTSSV